MDVSAEQLTTLNEKLVQEFGLRSSPFASSVSTFYEGAQRQHNLETIRHLSVFGDMVLLLTGVSGMGKTRLLEEFSKRNGGDVNIVMLSALVGTSQQSCLYRLAQLSGITPIDKEPPSNTLSRLIQKFEVEFQKDGKRTLWLLDDADHLDDGELSLFVSAFKALPPESGVVLLLVGLPDLVERSCLAQGDDQASCFHEIALKPLKDHEVLEYINLRLQAVGGQGNLELAASQVIDLLEASNGVPGLLHQSLAAVLFGVIKSDQTEEKASSNNGLLALMVVASILLLSFVFVSYQHGLFASDEIIAEEGDVEEEQKSLLVQKAQERDRAAEAANARLAMLDRALEERGLAMEAEPSGSEDEKVVDEGVVSPAEEKTLTNASEAHVEAVKPDVAVELSSVIAEEAKREPEPEPEPETGSVPVLQATAVDSLPKEEVVKADVVRRHKGFRSESWLNQRANGFTYQVLGSYNEETARKFIDGAGLSDGAVVYVESLYKEKPWFIVLYGDFKSKELARSGLKTAPQIIQRQKPWLRSYAAVIDSLP